MPGFGLSLGYTLLYLCLIVLIPLSATFLKTAGMSWEDFWHAVSGPRVLASYKLSFSASLGGAAINAVFGLLVAWVLVRYPFPGKKLVDALVDLPFALPTAVAGIALTAIYSATAGSANGSNHSESKSPSPPLGVMVALTFIGLPFVVRTVQPVLEDMNRRVGGSRRRVWALPGWQVFRRLFFRRFSPLC